MAELIILLVEVAGITGGLLLVHGAYALRDWFMTTIENLLFLNRPAKIYVEDPSDYREW